MSPIWFSRRGSVSLLFAVLEAKRFVKVRQTQELTISDQLSVLADICWYIQL